MNFSNEMVKKAKTASSAEELMRMAAEEGVALTEEEAVQYYDFLHTSRPLSGEELELVSGGKGGPKPKYKAGQRVWYWDPYGVYHEGTINSSWWVEFQQAFYYWVTLDNGDKMKCPLESDVCPVHVFG